MNSSLKVILALLVGIGCYIPIRFEFFQVIFGLIMCGCGAYLAYRLVLYIQYKLKKK